MAKKITESVTIMTELVLPNHTNQLGKLLGGQLMHWIDICAAMTAGRHNQTVCITASVDRIDFHHPISLGDPVTLVASINRVFNTSMEIGVKVFSENYKEGKILVINVDKIQFSENPEHLGEIVNRVNSELYGLF